jgi:hypothetical protein
MLLPVPPVAAKCRSTKTFVVFANTENSKYSDEPAFTVKAVLVIVRRAVAVRRFLGSGSREITQQYRNRMGQAIGRISEDGERVVRFDTDAARPHIILKISLRAETCTFISNGNADEY